MDVRRDGWFGRLTVNGKTVLVDESKNQVSQGSIMRIVSDALKSLAQQRVRGLADTTIQLTIASTQLTDAKMESVNRTQEIEQMLEGSIDTDVPFSSESYEDYYHRLIQLEYSKASAEFLAAQWFSVEMNPETILWLNDPKAIRFRKLNSNNEAYKEALPAEYESLKHYVQTTYPEFIEHLTFRTA